jgi:hypothetical protein
MALTPDEIMDALAAGNLEKSDIKMVELATIEKFDLSGPEKVLIETIRLRDGVRVE